MPSSSVLRGGMRSPGVTKHPEPHRSAPGIALCATVAPAGTYPQVMPCRVAQNAKSPGSAVPGRSHCVEGVLVSQIAS